MSMFKVIAKTKDSAKGIAVDRYACCLAPYAIIRGDMINKWLVFEYEQDWHEYCEQTSKKKEDSINEKHGETVQ